MMMNIEKLKAVLLWIGIIACCSVIMTFSFYLLLIAIPLFIIITMLNTPFSMYRSAVLKKAYQNRKNQQNEEVIDVDYEVVPPEDKK